MGPGRAARPPFVRSLRDGKPRRYITLDEAPTLAAAKVDPSGCIAALEGPVTLDEIQHAPELFPAIKVVVDRKREPGRFLLTGSANVLLLPRLAESLAGRMQLLTLWPLSQGEIEGSREGFLDAIFAEGAIKHFEVAETRDDLIRRALRGGYPGIIEWTDEGERGDWFNSYVTTLLQRDVRDLANVEGLTALPPLLSLLAVRSGSLVNFAELSRSAAIAQSTLKRYVTLFQATFMTDTVPAWSANLSKRLIKAPRLVVTDTGLMSHLARVNRARLDKASSKVAAEDFRGIETLRTVAGKRFHRGVVLYTGRQALPFGPGLHALPISALWRLGANEPRG